ncbi:MAG: AMP-binding protein [Pseudomonadota bacterium]
MNNLRLLTYFDIYEKNATHLGSSSAIHWKGQDTSYSDLFFQTACFANGLNTLNLPEKSRIAVLCHNHPVFFHLFGAASALNLSIVLINRRLSQDEMAYIIKDTTPSVLFCDMQMADKAKALLKFSPSIEHLFVVDETDEQFSNLYHQPPISAPVDSNPTDPFLIIHTAAVMGKPRGAVLSQTNIIVSNQQMIQAYGLDHTKTYLNILPLFHIMGINLGLGTLQAGGKNVIQDKFDPIHALELIQEQKVTMFGSFPPIVTSLLTAMKDDQHRFNLSSLEITAGLEAPDTAQNWETLSGSTFWTLYGQTETSGIVTSSRYFEKPGSAGQILPLTIIRTADEIDQLLPVGQTGEILVQGPLVFQGYWNADDLNIQTFKNGWHHTGDLGMIDADGFLFFKGRKPEKELIKPGGENVFPAEVEQTILEHDAINEVCVFGVPDQKFGEGIKAVCSLNLGYSLTKEELIEFCGQRIAGYKKPRYVQFINTLPKMNDGKIDRQKIKTDYT